MRNTLLGQNLNKRVLMLLLPCWNVLESNQDAINEVLGIKSYSTKS